MCRLESISIILCLSCVSFLITSIVQASQKDKQAGPNAALAVICGAFGLLLFGGTAIAQVDVKDHYVEYLELQLQVANYNDLDWAEQYQVYVEVNDYNTWYRLNQSFLESGWTFKGSSDYAKEFDYIVIGG